MKNTLYKPVLLVDEAQEVLSVCLNEIRLLQSDHFDSKSLLTCVLCGDMRLPQRFRTPQLASLGTRMRLRLNIGPYRPKSLLELLQHGLKHAGAEHLMTKELKQTLAEHAAGNLRVLNTLAADSLVAAAEKQLPQLDEKLFFELFSPQRARAKKTVKGKGTKERDRKGEKGTGKLYLTEMIRSATCLRKRYKKKI